GRLELLLLRCVREGAAPAGSSRDLARAVARARREGQWRDIVLEVERWLHAGAGTSDSTLTHRIEDAARHATAPAVGPGPAEAP
ncbi:MAG: hypothetical protein WAZ94_02715, partial [Phycisphaerales bacterium]